MATILLVSPDAGERGRLQAFLESEGNTVETEGVVSNFACRMASLRPDIAVLDCHTDPKGALEALRDQRRGEGAWDAACIALVEEGDSLAAEGAIEAGADDWLGWPARRQQLMTRVATQVRLRRLHEDLGGRLIESRLMQRQREQMMSMLTHDMKSPLTVIIGQLGLLEAGTLGEIPSEGARTALRRAARNAQRLLHYIEDFLTLSKTVAGAMEFAQEKFDLLPVLQEAVEEHRPTAIQERVTLELNAQATLGGIVGDEGLVMRALENLIINAMKYTPEGGKITVSACPDGDGVAITVADTGRGISAEDLPHIFEPFHRGVGAEKLVGGTGLGLSVVRTIVETHGGTVSAESTVGVGSEFTMHLPRRPGVTHRRIALIVEDNTDFARIMSMALRMEGIESVVCASAEEALEAVKSRRPDLITLDLMLPGMQGRQFAEALEKRFGEGVAPILALSASERRLEALGNIPIVRIRMSKDAFDLSEFRQAARELLRHG